MPRPRGRRMPNKQSACFSLGTQHVSHCPTSTSRCLVSLQLESTQVLPFSIYIYTNTHTFYRACGAHILSLSGTGSIPRCCNKACPSCYQKGWKVSLPRALSQSSDVFCFAFFLSLSLSFFPCVCVQKQLVELP